MFITLFGTAIFAQNDSGCPTLSIIGPTSVIEPGENGTFSASLEGNYDKKRVQYKWSVDVGKIIEGQGTSLITISTVGLNDTTITAGVEVSGLPCGNLTEYEMMFNDPPPRITIVDGFTKVSNSVISEKVKNLTDKINNEPSATAYIITCGSSIEISSREKLINEYIKIQKITPNKFVFLSNSDGKELRTIFYLVPPGATPPFPDCKDN